MKDSFDTDYGKVTIDNAVIARIAGLAALECAGIVGMSSVGKSDGVIKLLTRSSVTKGVKASINDNKIFLEFHIIVAFGVAISTIANNLIENVTYQVENATGLKAGDIKIYVDGVRTID